MNVGSGILCSDKQFMSSSSSDMRDLYQAFKTYINSGVQDAGRAPQFLRLTDVIPERLLKAAIELDSMMLLRVAQETGLILPECSVCDQIRIGERWLSKPKWYSSNNPSASYCPDCATDARSQRKGPVLDKPVRMSRASLGDYFSDN